MSLPVRVISLIERSLLHCVLYDLFRQYCFSHPTSLHVFKINTDHTSMHVGFTEGNCSCALFLLMTKTK